MDNEHFGSSNMGSGAGISHGAGAAEDKTRLGTQAGAALSKVTEVAQQAGSQVKHTATSLANEASERIQGFIDQKIASGADFMGSIGRSARAAAEALDPDAPQLAGLVRGVGDSVTDFAETVRGQSPQALFETASDFARRNPALVFGAAAVCGFALARVLQVGAWNGSRTNVSSGNSGMPG
jgi:hypothetical protein